MAARPAKRQRRSTTVLPDDEDETTEPLSLSLRIQDKDKRTTRGKKPATFSASVQTNKQPASSVIQSTSAKSSPQSSPNKTRKNNKQNLEVKNNKSLHSFFNKATEDQRWQKKEDSSLQASQEDSIADEIIDDDSLDDELVHLAKRHTVEQVAALTSKVVAGSRANHYRSSTPTSSQRFAKPTVSVRTTEPEFGSIGPEIAPELRPWADRFAPTNIDELAIHKKKVADVHSWLEDVISGKSLQKILVLKGPAGSGKSATISLIAQALGVEVVPWRNPAVSETGHASSIQQFSEFLDRGGQFEALSFGIYKNTSMQTSTPNQQMLMVEEFPIMMSRSSSILDTFRAILLQHVLRTAPSLTFGKQKTDSNNRPVVLVVSETVLTSSTALSDSFTAYRLLGPELSNHPLVSTIEFNPVAPTFISKAIDLVIKKEARESKRRRTPGPAVLQQLADVGDIRSAINSLEFLCARGDDAANWSGTVAARSKKTSKSSVPLTDVEKNTLQLISQRESTLDMFHATGKIVYNKREDPRVLDSRAEPPPKPPDHLMHLYASKISQVDVDALLSETGTDIQTFISTLHENYALSCNSEDFVDHFAGCSEFLSLSDFLSPENRSLIRAKGNSRLHLSNMQSGNFDMLRQDEISFHVASRGLLFALPCPVNRAVLPGVRKQDAFKMFYPASLRLWKPAEEIYDLVSMYANGSTNADVMSSMISKRTEGVTSWKTRSLAFGPMSKIDDEREELSVHPRSYVSRDDLVTEMLPYLTSIRIAQKEEAQMLKKITQLRGVHVPSDEMLDEEQYQEAASLLPTSVKLQQRVEEAHNLLQAQRLHSLRRNTGKGVVNGQAGTTGDSTIQEKMYISDDDIQDD